MTYLFLLPLIMAAPLMRISASGQQDPNLTDLILRKPKKALTQIYGTMQNAHPQIENLDENLPREEHLSALQRVIDVHTQSNPLFLLYECSYNKKDHCIFSRYTNPYRTQFENETVAKLSAHIQTYASTRPVVYASFGSGGLYQDLVILTQALTQYPTARLQAHLIDTEFTEYIKSLEATGHGRKILRLSEPRFMHPAHINFIQKSLTAADGPPEEAITKTIMRLYIMHARFRQFLVYLDRTFPHVCLEVFAHEHADSYINYSNSQDLPSPDLLVAADIQDDESLEQASMGHYHHLCHKSLQAKPTSENVLLGKNSEKRAALCTITQSGVTSELQEFHTIL